MLIKLSRPLEHDGKTLDGLTLDLDKLTGLDVEFCAREATIAAGGAIAVLNLDVGFHAQVAARACGLPVEILRKLPAPDFIAATMAVQGFLFGSG